MNEKLYIAGPEVFLPDAIVNASKQRMLCLRHGFQPLHPMDNNLDLGNKDKETAMRIYRGDIAQDEEADIIIANCNPFRGICMDDGTAYELGFGNALGKPSYGYVKELMSLADRTVRDYPCKPWKGEMYVDQDGYLITDDFGTSINLMMECGMSFRGGTLVEGSFEDCLKVIRKDLDSGKLTLVKERPSDAAKKMLARVRDWRKGRLGKSADIERLEQSLVEAIDWLESSICDSFHSH